MNFSIPFSGRAHEYTTDEISLVSEVMRRAVPLTQGAHLSEFEERFRQYSRVQNAFAVSNATSALELAAQLCQLTVDDEVIIPAHTFTSSAYPFARSGARLVWADIDLDTRVVTAQTIAQRITDRSRVIVVPHLYGYGVDMPAIMTLAKERGLVVVEDAAQALGVSVEGIMIGSFGDFGIYSFHSHKNMTTLGEGGVLAAKDSHLAELIPMLRHNGHCPFPSERQDYWVPAMGNVDFPMLNEQKLWPTNCCIGEVECALGVKLLERIDEINKQKRERAIAFIDQLEEYPELIFHRVDSVRHNYHLLVARVRNGLRDQFIRRMAHYHQIQCVVQYCPLNRYPFYQKLGFGEANCGNTDLFFDNMVSFPFHHSLTDSQIDQILNATRETVDYLRNE